MNFKKIAKLLVIANELDQMGESALADKVDAAIDEEAKFRAAAAFMPPETRDKVVDMYLNLKKQQMGAGPAVPTEVYENLLDGLQEIFENVCKSAARDNPGMEMNIRGRVSAGGNNTFALLISGEIYYGDDGSTFTAAPVATVRFEVDKDSATKIIIEPSLPNATPYEKVVTQPSEILAFKTSRFFQKSFEDIIRQRAESYRSGN